MRTQTLTSPTRPTGADEVWEWPPERKVKEAFLRASKIEAVRKELAIFFDPATQWAMAGVMSVVAVGMWASITYLTPITAAAVLTLAASYGIAHQITDVVTPFVYFLGTSVTAKSHADLDQAAKYLEAAVAKGGAALLLVVICAVLQVAGRLGLKLSVEARAALAKYQARADRTLRELAVVEKDVQGVLPPLGKNSGRCAWVAMARALRVLRKNGLVKVVNGQEVVTARDLAVATGSPLHKVKGLESDDILEILAAVGIKTRRIRGIPLENIDALVRQQGGKPVLFNFSHTEKQALNELLKASAKHLEAYASTGSVPTETLAAMKAATRVAEKAGGGHAIMAYFDKRVGKTVFVDYFGQISHSADQAILPYAVRPYHFDRHLSQMLVDAEQAEWLEFVKWSSPSKELLAPELIVLEDALVVPDPVTGPTLVFPLSVIAALAQAPVMNAFFGP